MRRYFQSMSGLLWVAVFALLLVQTADAHVHLCFDGQGQRSSLHVADAEVACHQGSDSSGTHQDQDIDALGAVVAKKSAQADTLDLPPILGLVLFVLSPQGGNDYETVIQNPPPKLPELFLPLQRGPPV